ncbi:succinate dehydrogenase assembly factor 2 [Marinicella sp. W31]|uniref:FAD assembly factor SdhE n=1 Tax=Marinicella sp. W31 TaxID=3023713 RepID=UPI003757BB41
MNTTFTSGYFKWRSRRGMKELDVMLNRFIDQQYQHMSADKLEAFNRLLDCQDTDLWYWFMGKSEPQDADFVSLVKDIRDASQSAS